MPVSVSTSYWHTVIAGMPPSRVRVHGMLREDGEALVLEYRERWRDPGTMQEVEGPRNRVEVPRAHVAGIDVRRGWFGRASLVIRANAFEALRGWPGAARDVCVLRVERDPEGAYLAAASDLALSIADAHLRALEAPSRSVRPSARDDA